MLSFQRLRILLFTVILFENRSCAIPTGKANSKAGLAALPQLPLITDDIISDKSDKENIKVIRVKPFDLPPIKEDPNILNMDSSLYKIQSHEPSAGKRKYINMRRSKPQTERDSRHTALSKTPLISGFSILHSPEKSPKLKHQPKRRPLHFLYNQEDLGGKLMSKKMRVHTAPGAYPVYYILSKTNGRFGKYPLKSFDNPQAFMKYLQKNKLQDLPVQET